MPERTDYSKMSPHDILHAVSAIVVGHFVLQSGLHSGLYIDKDQLAVHPHAVKEICGYVARWFTKERVEVVVGPERGAIILSQWTAFLLGELTGQDVLSVYTIKEPEFVGKKRGFLVKENFVRHVKGKRVVVVEDIATTGESVSNTIQTVRDAGGIVVGVAMLVNRGVMTAQTLGVENFYEVVTLKEKPPTWEAPKCPLCASKSPISIEVGHGKEFLVKQAAAAQPS